jgi:hypothetical protein
MMRRALVALALVLGCDPTQLPQPKPQVKPPPAAPEPAPTDPGPFWLPLAGVPEGPRAAAYRLDVAGGALVADRGGTRWLVPNEGEAVRAAGLDGVRHAQLMTDGAKVWSIGVDRRLRLAAEPLAPWQDKLALPEGATTLGVFQGGFTAVTATHALFSADLSAWRPLARFEERRPVAAYLDAEGRGIALFVPQAVATTSDGGASWQAADDSDVRADELRAQGDRVLVVPGGIRDGIARVWHGGLGLGRGFPEAGTGARIEVGSSAPLEWLDDGAVAAATAKGKSLRAASLLGFFRGWAAIDGDALHIAGPWPLDAKRALGGEATFDAHGLSDSCFDRAIAACAGRVVRACGRKLLDLRQGKEPRTLELKSEVEALGFIGPDVLLVANVSEASIVRLGGTGAPVEQPLGPHKLWRPSVLSSCSVEGRGWLVGYEGVVRVDGEVAAAISTVPKWVTVLEVLGLNESGNVVAVGRPAKGAPAVIGSLDADDGWSETELPFRPRYDSAGEHARLPSLLEGRGMLLGDDGNAYVTLDGGKTWSGVALPTMYGGGGERLVCTRSGCELEDVAFTARWSELPAPRSAEEPAAAAVSHAAAVSLRCDLVASDKTHKVPFLGPGAGDSLASGIGVDAAFDPDAGPPARASTTALEARVPFSGAPATSTISGIPFAGASVYGNVAATEGVGRVQVFAFGDSTRVGPLTVRWSGDKLTRRGKQRFASTTLPGTSVRGMLQTPVGLALIDPLSNEVLHVRADGTSELRVLPLLTATRFDLAEVSGALVELANKDWLAVAMSQGENDVALELARVDDQGLVTSRPLLHDGGLVALAVDGDQPFFVSEERLEDGRSELRARRIAADLRFGASTALAVVRDASGEPTIPPACSGNGDGVLVMFALGPVVVADGAGGELVAGPGFAQLAIGPTSVCTRRLAVAGLVVAGDGNGDAAMAVPDPSDEAAPGTLARYRCKRQ